VLPESAMRGGDDGAGGPNTVKISEATGSASMLGFPHHQFSAAAAAAVWAEQPRGAGQSKGLFHHGGAGLQERVASPSAIGSRLLQPTPWTYLD
jgi:hypothetical protein